MALPVLIIFGIGLRKSLTHYFGRGRDAREYKIAKVSVLLAPSSNMPAQSAIDQRIRRDNSAFTFRALMRVINHLQSAVRLCCQYNNLPHDFRKNCSVW
jgi:hypothetical protein